jgi:hypothetical protein
MAKVWFVCEGPDPTIGNAAYELPAREAIEKLAVARDSILPQRPKFNPTSPLGRIAGYCLRSTRATLRRRGGLLDTIASPEVPMRSSRFLVRQTNRFEPNKARRMCIENRGA